MSKSNFLRMSGSPSHLHSVEVLLCLILSRSFRQHTKECVSLGVGVWFHAFGSPSHLASKFRLRCSPWNMSTRYTNYNRFFTNRLGLQKLRRNWRVSMVSMKRNLAKIKCKIKFRCVVCSKERLTLWVCYIADFFFLIFWLEDDLQATESLAGVIGGWELVVGGTNLENLFAKYCDECDNVFE